MKNTLFTFIALTVILATSCTKENELKNIQLVGTWKMVKSTDDYNNNNGFTHYQINDANFINVTINANNNIVIYKNNEVLFEGICLFNAEKSTIALISDKEQNNIVLTLTLMSTSKNAIKIGYKTTNGQYEHWFIRK